MCTVLRLTVRRTSMVLLLGMLSALLTCLSAPQVSAHNGDVHQLRLLAIRCWETEDATFDEAYLKVDGTKVWGPRTMGRNYDVSLEGIPPRLFVDSVSVKLYDEDGGLFDPDDNLGRITIPASQAGSGNHTIWFTADDDAVYSLIYQVI